MVNIYFIYKIRLWAFNIGKDFALRNYLFGAVKLTDNADPDQYKYFGYYIGFHAWKFFDYQMVLGLAKIQ